MIGNRSSGGVSIVEMSLIPDMAMCRVLGIGDGDLVGGALEHDATMERVVGDADGDVLDRVHHTNRS